VIAGGGGDGTESEESEEGIKVVGRERENERQRAVETRDSQAYNTSTQTHHIELHTHRNMCTHPTAQHAIAALNTLTTSFPPPILNDAN
jgi:hypothetical protein